MEQVFSSYLVYIKYIVKNLSLFAWALHGWSTLHGGPVQLRPIRLTPYFLCYFLFRVCLRCLSTTSSWNFVICCTFGPNGMFSMLIFLMSHNELGKTQISLPFVRATESTCTNHFIAPGLPVLKIQNEHISARIPLSMSHSVEVSQKVMKNCALVWMYLVLTVCTSSHCCFYPGQRQSWVRVFYCCFPCDVSETNAAGITNVSWWVLETHLFRYQKVKGHDLWRHCWHWSLHSCETEHWLLLESY